MTLEERAKADYAEKLEDLERVITTYQKLDSTQFDAVKGLATRISLAAHLLDSAAGRMAKLQERGLI